MIYHSEPIITIRQYEYRKGIGLSFPSIFNFISPQSNSTLYPYEFLPDDFPVPACAIVDVDGTGEWRSEDNKRFSYHFTTVKHDSEELYDLYKDYLEHLNYTFKEDRVEAGYQFVSLDVYNDTNSFMINLHDTLDDGRVAVGVYYVIN